MSINTQNGWSKYVIPPVAAGAAIIPVFYGFKAKIAWQLGNPLPSVNMLQLLKGGLGAAPVISTQVLLQLVVEEQIAKVGNQGFPTMLASALTVGSLSVPLLTILNGQAQDRSWSESLRRLSFKQAGALVARETSFLFSVRVSRPISNAMKEMGGDHPLIEHGSAFVTGVIGSLFGHPPDTAFTLWQNGRKFTLSQSMRGVAPRALACGSFTMIYSFINRTLCSSATGKK